MSINAPVAERRVFTTGQVAKICEVAPRTASKWIDSGALKGYRIPGSDDRRVRRADLGRFLEDRGFPTDGFDDVVLRRVLLVGFPPAEAARLRAAIEAREPYRVVEAADLFGAGVRFGACRPRAVLVHSQVGRLDAGLLAASVCRDPELAGTALLLIGPGPDVPGFDERHSALADPASLANRVVALTSAGRDAR